VGSPRGGDPGARRSLSAAMDVDVGSSASVAAAAGDGADFDLRRSTADFLSHSCR
jgi:DNA polymerase theta